MGYTIVSGKNPLHVSVGLHQNYTMLFIEMIEQKGQSFILNLKMPKFKYDGAEESTNNNFYKIYNRKC